MKRGRPPKVSRADQHEMRRYREAGVPIKDLAKMWNIAETTVNAILRSLRKQLGPERLPADKEYLRRTYLGREQPARQSIHTCEKTTPAESHS